MTPPSDASHGRAPRLRREWLRWTAVLVLASASMISFSLAASATSPAKNPKVAVKSALVAKVTAKADTSRDATTYPNGVADSNEPSGESPPDADAMSGYKQVYVNDFNSTGTPSGWGQFNGQPGSDPGGMWLPSHVQVFGGMLTLNTFEDSGHNNQWVSGGICQCGVSHTYGAYFVRSRLTGPGPTQVELLWPTGNWPPEIDFDETDGTTTSSTATVHFDANNDQIQNNVNVDMTQWHTWGVIWTPNSITFTLDGVVWGTVNQSSAIPDQPMTLDIQQQTWCSSNWACPTNNESTLVDWVAEYEPVSGSPVTTTSSTTTTILTAKQDAKDPITVRPFAPNSWALSDNLKTQIRDLAEKIRYNKDSSIALVGFSDDTPSKASALKVSRLRAVVVERYLKQQLKSLGDAGVKITAEGEGNSSPAATNGTPQGRSLNRRVVALIS